MHDQFKYLVNLDALLDVRLGVVSLLDADYAKSILPTWNDRTTDRSLKNVPNVPYSQIKTYLKSGNIDVLGHSLPTTITNLIYTYIKEFLLEGIVGDSVNVHQIVVNVYPYELSKEEKDVIKEVIESRIPNSSGCDVVSISPTFLSPSYLSSNKFTHYITYDFQDWLNLYIDELMKNPIPSIVMVCPKLLDTPVEEAELSDEAKTLLPNLSPFSAMELQFVMYVSLRFVDVNYFSVFKPVRHKEEAP